MSFSPKQRCEIGDEIWTNFDVWRNFVEFGKMLKSGEILLADHEIAKNDHSTKPEWKKTENAVKMHQFLS